MDIRPTPNRDVFEVWHNDDVAVYWKDTQGRYWVMCGGYDVWVCRITNGAQAEGELSAQVRAAELLGAL